jgi:hypothetical protein
MADRGGTRKGAPRLALFLPVFVVLAGIAPLVAGAPAGAAPRELNSSTTCPTEAYTGAAIGNCGSTTTTTQPSGSVVLRSAAGPSYANGRFTWEICGYPASATGDTIVLYIGGQTESGWTTTVQSNGCASFSVPWCPTAGAYTVAAVDQTHSNIPEATGRVEVSSGAACAASGGHGGALAFTGTNILWVLLAAIVAIVLGYMIVKSNRQRRRAE